MTWTDWAHCWVFLAKIRRKKNSFFYHTLTCVWFATYIGITATTGCEVWFSFFGFDLAMSRSMFLTSPFHSLSPLLLWMRNWCLKFSYFVVVSGMVLMLVWFSELTFCISASWIVSVCVCWREGNGRVRCEFGSFNVDGLWYGMVGGSLSLEENIWHSACMHACISRFYISHFAIYSQRARNSSEV